MQVDPQLTQQQLLTDNEIEEREKEIRELQKQQQDINEIFKYVSEIVKKQQPYVDNIESNIESTKEYTSKGVEELEKASKQQKKILRCNIL